MAASAPIRIQLSNPSSLLVSTDSPPAFRQHVAAFRRRAATPSAFHLWGATFAAEAAFCFRRYESWRTAAWSAYLAAHPDPHRPIAARQSAMWFDLMDSTDFSTFLPLIQRSFSRFTRSAAQFIPRSAPAPRPPPPPPPPRRPAKPAAAASSPWGFSHAAHELPPADHRRALSLAARLAAPFSDPILRALVAAQVYHGEWRRYLDRLEARLLAYALWANDNDLGQAALWLFRQGPTLRALNRAQSLLDHRYRLAASAVTTHQRALKTVNSAIPTLQPLDSTSDLQSHSASDGPNPTPPPPSPTANSAIHPRQPVDSTSNPTPPSPESPQSNVPILARDLGDGVLSSLSHQSMNYPTLTHLRALEAEAIHILRETAAQFRKPVLLYSIGKDSSCLVHLARKAFHPGRIPFPLLHVDTTYEYPEMIEFRDSFTRQIGADLRVYTNQQAIAEGANPYSLGTSKCCHLLRTRALVEGLQQGGYDAAIGGARRDEEKSRAKERVFSFRDKEGRWDPRNQRPELWNLFNGRVDPGESIRVFPLSNWTEMDVWRYIDTENIPIVPLYFAKPRQVVIRGGTVIPLESNVRLLDGEKPETVMCRMRSLGCTPCSGAIRSEADTVAKIIDELSAFRRSERENRVIDHDQEGSMELKKREGYF